jgi:hypothetical protein
MLPLVSGGTYDFTVTWGDSTSSVVTSHDDSDATHTYEAPGTYTLTISGVIEGFAFRDAGDKAKILDVSQWGSLKLGATSGFFQGATNFNSTASDAPDLSATTSLSNAFAGATSFNGPIGNWNVSTITDLNSTFEGATTFNQPINSWEVAAVGQMRAAFLGATSFNQPLNQWNVSKVTHFGIAFNGASSFNQDLSGWDIASGGVDAQTVTQLDGFLSGTALSPQNYGLLLIGWAGLTNPTTGQIMSVNANGDNAPNQFDTSARYTVDPAILEARAALVAQGWNITDGGKYYYSSVGQSTRLDISYTNTQAGEQVFVDAQLGSRNAKDFSIVSSDCLAPRVMAVGDTCTTVVTWAPLGEGSGLAELRLLPSLDTPNVFSVVGMNYDSTGNCATNGFAGGDGTPADPYLIATTAQFNCINGFSTEYLFLGSNFKLTQDLDFGGNPEAFQEISTWNTGFWGTLDGDNHTVSGISDASAFSSLVPWLTGNGVVKNLVLNSPQFVSDYDAGSITAYADGSAQVENVRVKGGQVKSLFGGFVGGLAGYAENLRILKSSSSTTVQMGNEYAGNRFLGGLVGQAVAGTSISKSFSTGAVTYVAGNSDESIVAGGLVGLLNSSHIANSYSTGAVTLTSQSTSLYVGALVGDVSGGTITRSFATGVVASAIGGGFAGRYVNAPVVADSFWDTEATGLATDGTDSTIADAGRTTAQLKSIANFEAWDNIATDELLARDWTLIAGSYPQLSYEIARLKPAVEVSPVSTTPTVAPTTPTVTPSPSASPSPVVVAPKPLNMSTLTTGEIKKLTASAISQLNSSQVAKITSKQIAVFTKKQLVAIKPKVIPAIKPKTVAAISATNLKALTKLQKKALTKTQLAALSKTQKKAVGR